MRTRHTEATAAAEHEAQGDTKPTTRNVNPLGKTGSRRRRRALLRPRSIPAGPRGCAPIGSATGVPPSSVAHRLERAGVVAVVGSWPAAAGTMIMVSGLFSFARTSITTTVMLSLPASRDWPRDELSGSLAGLGNRDQDSRRSGRRTLPAASHRCRAGTGRRALGQGR